MDKSFSTLRGFLRGTERQEETYFSYSATLRISGDIPDLERISSRLGLKPTHSHLKGERRGTRSVPYRHDVWSYSPAIEESEPLDSHISALWSVLKPHKRYLLRLKKSLT